MATNPQTGATFTVVMEAVDNDPPLPDRLRFSFAPFITAHPTLPGCFVPFLPPVPVTEGQIVIHDGQPK